MKKRLHMLITGKVQGVFFRVTTKKNAEILGLTGWARNASNGAVEVLAEGEEKNLKELLNLCYNEPKGAEVQSVEEKWEKYRGEFDKFNILL